MSSSTLTNDERTALIPKSQSQVVISDQNYTSTISDVDVDEESIDGKGGREVEVYKPGKSSFTQTVCPPLTSLSAFPRSNAGKQK
jgi:hypothetical protein